MDAPSTSTLSGDKQRKSLLLRIFWNPLTTPLWCVLLLGLIYSLYDYQSRRNWEAYKEQMKARGMPMEWAAHVPAPVSKEQNFARTPLLEGIKIKSKVMLPSAVENFNLLKGDFSTFAHGHFWTNRFTDLAGMQCYLREITNGTSISIPLFRQNSFYREFTNQIVLPPLPREPAEDVLDLLQYIATELNELREAARERPLAQFECDISGNPWEIPSFIWCRNFTQIFQFSSSAKISLKDSGGAFEDWLVMIRFIDALENYPILVCAMLRPAIATLTLQTFWEGLATGVWTDEQLERFQEIYGEMDFLTAMDRGVIGDRASLSSMVERVPHDELAEMLHLHGTGWKVKLLKESLRILPRGLRYQNLVSFNRYFDSYNGAYELTSQRVYPLKTQKGEIRLASIQSGQSPLEFLARVYAIPLNRSLQNCATKTTAVRQAAIACALEKYRRKHQVYPEDLAALVPGYISELPEDILTGEDFKYHRTSDGKYVLYSPGWDLTDNGGKFDFGSKMPEFGYPHSDWIFPFPESGE